MKISTLLIAGGNKRFVAQAIEAAHAAFPGTAVTSVDSLKAAQETEASPSPELLVIAEADEAKIREAVQAVDGSKLPRWAVVAMGGSGPMPFAEVVTEAEWSLPLLTRVFRTAVAMHLLHRERERLRGDLLSIGIRISHDLRTPVGGIFSATEVLDMSLSAAPPAVKSLTQPIFESANDLVRIIGQLTLVSKASARPDSRQQFNMATPVGRALERVEMKVREKGATVSAPKTWPDASGDPTSAENVWVGLLENAIRHSGKAPRIELGWEEAGDGNKFWVRDYGPGVPPAKQRSLFYPFHRLHEPSAARGLGLPIVERLVRLQGGRCGYEAGTPAGSCFFFTLAR
jgi:K+-sensing histidine kinase KdpD